MLAVAKLFHSQVFIVKMILPLKRAQCLLLPNIEFKVMYKKNILKTLLLIRRYREYIYWIMTWQYCL